VRFAAIELTCFGEVLPGPGHSRHLRLATELAVGAHLARHPRHFRGKPAELIDHRVDDLPDPQEFTPQRPAVDLRQHPLGEITSCD